MITMVAGRLSALTILNPFLIHVFLIRRYVLHRSSDWGIRIYFWSRYDFTVPSEIREPRERIHPSFDWGIPQAVFPFTEKCSPDHFNAHQIIFDLTFCVSTQQGILDKVF